MKPDIPDWRVMVSFSPALQSLFSRGVRLRTARLRDQAPDLERIIRTDVQANTITLSVSLRAALRAETKEYQAAFIESIGRWAIAQFVRAELASQNGLRRILERWSAWFALRPLLYIYTSGATEVFRHEVTTSLVKLFGADLGAESLSDGASLSENLRKSRIAMLGQDRLANEAVTRAEKQRFSAPPKKMIVYFRRAADGLLLPVFGPVGKYRFLSKYNPSPITENQKARRRQTSALLLSQPDFDGSIEESDLRQAYNVPLQQCHYPVIERATAPHLERLPEAVRNILERDGALATTSSDNGSPESFSLLMYGSSNSRSDARAVTGRTGVLFENGRPCIVEIEEMQYLIEIKGAGCPEGGYPVLLRRSSGEMVPAGGLQPEYGKDEYDGLCAAESGSEGLSVKPVLLVEFERPGSERQCILVRLTPSVERLSFVGFSKALSRGLQSNANGRTLSGIPVMERIQRYGHMFARLMSQTEPNGHLAAHLENVLAGEFGDLWQDYADIIPLFPGRGHYSESRTFNRKHLTMCVLNQTFFYLARSAQLFHDTFGLSYETFSRLFYNAYCDELLLARALDDQSASLLRNAAEPLRLPNGQGITEFLWERVFALDNFVWSKRHYDLPAMVFQDINGAVPVSLARQFLESETQFLRQALAIALRNHANDQAGDLVNEIEENIATAQQLLEEGFAGGARAQSLLLPYLTLSMNAPIPRKPVSWTPPM